MDDKSQKRFLIIFLSVFIVAGLGLAIYGFVRLGQYNAAEEVQATVVSCEYYFEKQEMDVVVEFERGGETVSAKGHYTNVKTLPYYKGQQITAHINKNNQIVTYGTTDIVVTVGGGRRVYFGGKRLFVLWCAEKK